MKHPDIYSYIKAEEAAFETDHVKLGDNWEWNFRDHVQLIFHLKNGVFFTGENNWLRAFKHVMRPLLRLAYWTEDIEVKDVVFFIENAEGRALSFLVKKYHDEIYVREHDLDTLFDDITESDIDYGGALLQKTNTKRPELFALNSIAFCDQTDTLGGPIAFKHYFSPDALRKMSSAGWGQEQNGATVSIEDLITLAEDSKDPAAMNSTQANKVPGKVVELYIVRGNLPGYYLTDNQDDEDVYNQVQIIGFYTDKDKKKQGVTLYRKKESEGNLKFHASEKVHGRGLGYSDGEMLLHPQIWTNFANIHKMGLIEAAGTVALYTDDSSYTNRNKIQDMENLEITTIEPGTSIQQVPTAAPANLQLIDNSINDWFEVAQLGSAAFDPILGKEQTSGTTFRGQERTVAQGRGWHDRRRGQRAKFIEAIYRDWIIPDIVKEITNGKKFLATLSADELSWVSDQLATNQVNSRIKEAMFKGKILTKEETEEIKTLFKTNFAKKGNKHLLEILKGELDDVALRMGINIAGKQKDLAVLSDKVLSIFQFVFANPGGFQQAMQNPALAKAFNDILEFSGLSQTDFAALTMPPTAAPTAPEEMALPAAPAALNPQPVQAA